MRADLGTGAIDEVTVPGGAPSDPPGELDFWSAQASGPGMQRLDWEPEEGDWLFVVMNADGSAGASTDARVGATVPALGGLGWGLLGSGAFLTLIGVSVLVIAIRRPARHTGTPARAPGAYPPSGPPPPWTPPAPADRTTAADARPDPASTGQPPRGTDNG